MRLTTHMCTFSKVHSPLRMEEKRRDALFHEINSQSFEEEEDEGEKREREKEEKEEDVIMIMLGCKRV